MYEAGLTPNNLKPVAAEIYGTPESKFSHGVQDGVLWLCLLVEIKSPFIGSYHILDTSKCSLWGVSGE